MLSVALVRKENFVYKMAEIYDRKMQGVLHRNLSLAVSLFTLAENVLT